MCPKLLSLAETAGFLASFSKKDHFNIESPGCEPSLGRSSPLAQQPAQQPIPCLLIMKKQNIIIAIIMMGNIHQKLKPKNHEHGNMWGSPPFVLIGR